MNFFKTSLLLAALTSLFMVAGYLIAGTNGVIIAFIIAIATNALAFWNSDKIALRMHNAEPVTRAGRPELYSIIEDLARKAEIPMPRVMVINSDQPNAFATGRNPDNAAVAVTSGIMKILSREELSGVIAHELAHIKNRDTLIMTIAATVAGAISMLAQFGMYFGRGRDKGGAGIIGMLLAIFLAPVAAALIQMMISRTREYSADSGGADICRNPLWLASGLRRISDAAKHIEMESAERNPATAHLFIINPLSGRAMDGLFSTHPNVENRIKALEDMAGSGHYQRPTRATIRRSNIPTSGRGKGNR